MCGIAGIISSDPSLVTQQRLTRMTDALAHRGPNGAFHWINTAGTTGLAHRRLAIIDISDAAAQPKEESEPLPLWLHVRQSLPSRRCPSGSADEAGS